jgi:hypothetical protein
MTASRPGPIAGEEDLPIVVWAPHFDEKSGGTIVLHLLAFRLREMGVEVYLSNAVNPSPNRHQGGPLQRALAALRDANRRRRAWRRYRRNPDISRRRPWHVATHTSLPVPTMPDLRGRRFIAVYPEIVDGNPLGADHVVRWLLFHPGFHAPDARFTENELVFYYQRAFLTEGHDVPEDHFLQLHWIRDDVYRDRGLGDRYGTCRMVRKGQATFDPSMAAGDRFGLLDTKSHAEIAEIFSQCEYFVSHDLYTLYFYYAALCGCVPMAVPQPGLDGATWREGYELCFGVAYGEAELDWARATRTELIAEMAAVQARELDMVRSFVRTLRAHVASATA